MIPPLKMGISLLIPKKQNIAEKAPFISKDTTINGQAVATPCPLGMLLMGVQLHRGESHDQLGSRVCALVTIPSHQIIPARHQPQE